MDLYRKTLFHPFVIAFTKRIYEYILYPIDFSENYYLTIEINGLHYTVNRNKIANDARKLQRKTLFCWPTLFSFKL